MSTQRESIHRTTVRDFARLKQSHTKFVMLTAYDALWGELLDECEIPAILVGDSLAMVVQGHENTIPVTLDEMIYHARLVTRVVRRAMVVVDIPFPGCFTGTASAIEQAAKILKQTNAQAVKLEGGAEQADVIAGLVKAGIPVMAHVGLRPQSVHQLGGYLVQRHREQLLRDATAAAEAGAFAVVLECIPREIAGTITQQVAIPTIGIGAGPDCDGQILVTQDLLGLTHGRIPKFVRPYAQLRGQVVDAVRRFQKDVQSADFPGSQESFE